MNKDLSGWVFIKKIRFRRALILLTILAAVLVGWPYGFFAYAENIAQGKPYFLSPQPNYQKYSLDQVSSNLTNGKHASSRMWTSDQGLVWVRTPRISINIDLESEHLLGTIRINLAAGVKGQVEFPLHAYTYVSRDGKKYYFVGDFMEGQNGLSREDYIERAFEIREIRRLARFVRIEVIPKGLYLSVDEVSVEGASGKSSKYNQMNQVDSGQIAKDFERRFSKSTQKAYSENDSNEAARLQFTRSEKSLAQARRRFDGKAIVVESVSPWGNLSPFSAPQKNIRKDAFSLFVPVGGCLYRAYRVTNLSQAKRNIRLKQTVSEPGFTAGVFHVDVVRDQSGSLKYDPLTPVEKPMALSTYWSNLFLVRMCDVNGGKAKYKLVIDDADTKDVYLDVSGAAETVAIEGHSQLDATTWSYLTAPEFSRKGREAANDLAEHHESTIVVPVTLLKSFPKLNEQEFEKYISVFDENFRKGKFTKIVLFLGLRGNPLGKSDGWSQSFLDWHKKAYSMLAAHGWRHDQIYLYPYDEPNGEDAAAAAEVIAWLRKNIVEVNIFLTVNSVNSLSLLPAADIVAVVPQVAASNNIRDMSKVWLYGTSGSAKQNSVYSYYRLLPWRAFSYGMAGVGFWSYSDRGHAGWNDDFGGGRVNYSPVYFNASGELVSSLRWEAWAQGLRDVVVLRAGAKRMNTGELAKTVLERAEAGGGSGADDVIQSVLLELRKMD